LTDIDFAFRIDLPDHNHKTIARNNIMDEKSTRSFFIDFLEKCEKGQPVLVVNGKPSRNPAMSRDESALRLALYDRDIMSTPKIELELAEYEAARWPKSRKAQAKVSELRVRANKPNN
jgi:hypothetical protein